MEKELSNYATILYCYALEDQFLCQELDKQLIPLQRLGIVTTWFYQKMRIAEVWNQKLFDISSIFLLLISPDFLASDFYTGIEIVRVLEKQELEKAIVIPILLRPVDWMRLPIINELQILPTSAKPVTMWANRDEALLDVAQGIYRAVISLLQASMYVQEPMKEEGVPIFRVGTSGSKIAITPLDLIINTLNMEGTLSAEQLLRIEQLLRTEWLLGTNKPAILLTFCEQAILSDPTDTSPYRLKAKTLTLIQQYREASETYDALAQLLDQLNQHQEADHARKSAGVILNAEMILARLSSSSRLEKKILTLLQRYTGGKEASETYDVLAQFLDQLNQHQEADYTRMEALITKLGSHGLLDSSTPRSPFN